MTKPKPPKKKKQGPTAERCGTCAFGCEAIRADFAELGPKLADAAGMLAHYTQLHGHAFDAPRWGQTDQCAECHAVGRAMLAAKKRQRKIPASFADHLTKHDEEGTR